MNIDGLKVSAFFLFFLSFFSFLFFFFSQNYLRFNKTLIAHEKYTDRKTCRLSLFYVLLEHILKFIDILRAFISFIVLVSLNKSSKTDIVISFIYLDFTEHRPFNSIGMVFSEAVILRQH